MSLRNVGRRLFVAFIASGMCLYAPVGSAQDYSQFRTSFSFETTGITSLTFNHRDCQLWAANGSPEVSIQTFYGKLLDSFDPGIGAVSEVSVGATSAVAVNNKNEFHLLNLKGVSQKILLTANKKRKITGVFWDEAKNEVWFTDAASKRLYTFRGGKAYRIAQLDYEPTDMDRDLTTETTFVGGPNLVDRFFQDRRARTSYAGSTTTSTLSTDAGRIGVSQSGGKTVTQFGAVAPNAQATSGQASTSIATKMIDNTFVGVYLSLDNGRTVKVERNEMEEYRNKRPGLTPGSCEGS